MTLSIELLRTFVTIADLGSFIATVSTFVGGGYLRMDFLVGRDLLVAGEGGGGFKLEILTEAPVTRAISENISKFWNTVRLKESNAVTLRCVKI